jgi:hypothetical protein
MHIYNDFQGWGLQELAENQVRVLWSALSLANAFEILEFEAALKKTGDEAFKQMWHPISGLALCLNEIDQGDLISS